MTTLLKPENKELTLDLVHRTGYQLEQDNGQRKYGPPPGWVGPPPRKTEVFVGSLPRDIYEYELVPFFEKIGRIYMLRTMLSFSGFNRGYAFVKYCRPEDAERAIRELNKAEIRPGQRIGVVRSLDNCRLYVGNLPKNCSVQEVLDQMRNLTEDVIDVQVYPDRNSNSCYAFVEYGTHKAAAKARRKLLPAQYLIRDRIVTIDWATPEPEIDQNCIQSATNLYIRHLNPNVTEDRLQNFFSFNGLLKLIKVKKMHNYAFINYQTRQDAQKALHLLHNLDTAEFSSDNISLDVTWAKPSNRNKQNRTCSFTCHTPTNQVRKDLNTSTGSSAPYSPPANNWPMLTQPQFFSSSIQDLAFFHSLVNYTFPNPAVAGASPYSQLGHSLVDFVN